MANKTLFSEYFQLLNRSRHGHNYHPDTVFAFTLMETTEALIVALDNSGKILEFNPACEKLSGYRKEEVLGKTPDFLLPDEERAGVKQVIDSLLAGDQTNAYENHWISKKGSKRLLMWSNSSIKDDRGNVTTLICTGLDITDSRERDTRRLVILDILEVLASAADQTAVIRRILHVVREYLRCDAVGVRLQRGGDYPYLETLGFSEAFLKTENSLYSTRTNTLLREDDGQSPLECICGQIICGELEPSLTVDGAFYTGCISEQAAQLAKSGASFKIRSHCSKAGFESIALIPLRFQNETVGLLQLNDRQREKFSKEDIHFLAMIGRSIGAALVRFQAEQERRTYQLILDTIIKKARDGFSLSTQMGEFVIYNEAMRHITGYSRDEVNKHGWFYLAYPHEEERRQAVHKARQAMAGKLDLMETIITCKDGTRKPVAFSVTPLEIDNTTYNFSTLIDLSSKYKGI